MPTTNPEKKNGTITIEDFVHSRKEEQNKWAFPIEGSHDPLDIKFSDATEINKLLERPSMPDGFTFEQVELAVKTQFGKPLPETKC
jgi:hypothetical protein